MKISTADIKTLWGRAGGRCSICEVTLTADKQAGKVAYPIGQHAHIVAEEEGGPRGISPLSKEERNRYANLILLCPTCHTRADKAPEDFTADRLYEYKKRHEERLEQSNRVKLQHISSDVNEAVLDLLSRIRRIFSANGVLPTQWERFFRAANAPFSISLEILSDDWALARWLSDEKIQWIADTFLIRRDWIDGSDSGVHFKFYFDKNPQLFFDTVCKNINSADSPNPPDLPAAYFIRCGRDADWLRAGESRVLVIVRIPIVGLGDNSVVYRYISDLEDYPWDGSRTQIQLRAWTRLLFVNKSIPCFGCDLPLDVSREIVNNSVFLHEVFESGELRRHIWHPDDFAVSSGESLIAKDVDSLPVVLKFLQKNGLPFEETSLTPVQYRATS